MFKWIILCCVILLAGCAEFIPQTCARPDWSMNIDGIDDTLIERYQTGTGFHLIGIIRDANTCQPLSNVAINFDMTNAEGDYDGVNQGRLYSNELGLFLIESGRPGAYGGGPPHVHLSIGKDGYRPITTAYNLTADNPIGWLEITIEPTAD